MLLFFRNDDGLRRQQRLHRLQAHPRLPDRDARARACALFVHHAALSWSARSCCALRSCTVEVRPRADRRSATPRARVMFSRLRPAALQAVRLDAVGGDVRHRRRALRAAGRHHQPERDVAGELDRDRDLGGGRRPRDAGRARSSARASSTAPRAGSPRRSRSTGLLLGALFIARHAVPAARRRGARRDQAARLRRRRARSGRAARRACRRPATTAQRAAGDAADRRRHVPRQSTLRTARSCISKTSRVSFDGFKALNDLSLDDRRRASCAASSGRTARARRR